MKLKRNVKRDILNDTYHLSLIIQADGIELFLLSKELDKKGITFSFIDGCLEINSITNSYDGLISINNSLTPEIIQIMEKIKSQIENENKKTKDFEFETEI